MLGSGCMLFLPDRSQPPVVALSGSIADLWAGNSSPSDPYLWILRAEKREVGQRVVLEFDVALLDGDGRGVGVELRDRCEPSDNGCAVWTPGFLATADLPESCELKWSAEQRDVNRSELSVMIVADVSGSMQPYARELISTLDAVSQAARERDGRVAIALFDNMWQLACTFEGGDCGASAVQDLLSSGKWWGGTSLWDASIHGLNHLRTEDPARERILVVISDGEDGGSVDTLEDFVSQALQAELAPLFIEVSADSASSALKHAALGSNGDYIDRPSMQNLSRYYAILERGIRSHLHVIGEIDCPEAKLADLMALTALAELPARGSSPAQRVSAHRPFVKVGPPSNCTPDHSSLLAVQFDLDESSTVVDQRLSNWLTVITERLDRFPGWRLDLYGEADGRGRLVHNRALSKARGEFVKAELIARGADPSRIRVVALGEGKVDTEETRPELRRVTFTWIELDESKRPPGCE